MAPSKFTAFQTALFELPARFTRAKVLTAELLNEFLHAVDRPLPALDPGFRGEPFPPLAHGFKSVSCFDPFS